MQKDTHEKIFFFQGSDIVAPSEMSDEEIFGIVSENNSGSTDGWKTDLLNIVSQRNGPLVPEKIPALNGSDFISAVLLDESALLTDAWKRLPIRSVLRYAERMNAGFSGEVQDLFRAYHILQWRKSTIFCGRCGGKNRNSEKDISRVCNACGNITFPKISPAVIVLITDDEDRILLAHNRNFKNQIYSLIAGFVEAGESLEETVAREVKEEVNIDIGNIEYCLSQPWPFPDSIMLGFRAKHAGGNINPDGVEITDADWFPRDALPEIPGPGAIARFLIDQWRNKI